MNIDIKPIKSLKDNYIWSIIDQSSHTTVIVDPGEAKPVEDFLQKQGLSLTGILLTHHHWDHTGGVEDLLEHHPAPVFGPKGLAEGEIVHIHGFPLDFEVLTIPGHTLDHIAFYTPGMLFCGDTLFSAGCGRVFEGTAPQMYAALMKLATLPDETKVYCAHEYTLNNLRFAETIEPDNKAIQERIRLVSELRNQDKPSLPSTIKIEKLINPFFRSENVEVFTQRRLLKDKF